MTDMLWTIWELYCILVVQFVMIPAILHPIKTIAIALGFTAFVIWRGQ
jgi:hypothetical protein